jgi:thiamine kinase-like enzyme
VTEAISKAAGLSFWKGPVSPEPLGGGITNLNFVVEDQGRRYVVRIGDDIAVHGILRFNELAASRAAHAAGVSPAVVHAEPGVLVMDFVEGRTLVEDDVRAEGMLERIVPLIQRIHTGVMAEVRGPVLMFWVFHVVRDYAATLRQADSRMVKELPRLLAINDELENLVAPVHIVFAHNDLLAANFIDAGDRLWIVDWDYAGFGSPLFDLANLASNNLFDESQERRMLEIYFGTPADDGLMRRYGAMKCASLMREAMWSMTSEVHSELDFDYVAYTEENMERFESAYRDFGQP